MRWFDKPRKTKGYVYTFFAKKCESCKVNIRRESVYWYDEYYVGDVDWNPITGKWTHGKYHRHYFCPECGVRIYGEVI